MKTWKVEEVMKLMKGLGDAIIHSGGAGGDWDGEGVDIILGDEYLRIVPYWDPEDRLPFKGYERNDYQL